MTKQTQLLIELLQRETVKVTGLDKIDMTNSFPESGMPPSVVLHPSIKVSMTEENKKSIGTIQDTEY